MAVRRVSVLLLAPLVALSTVASTSPPAQAPHPDGSDSETVIYSAEPTPELLLGVNAPLADGARVGSDPSFSDRSYQASEPAHVPEPGETITVVHTDAISTYTTQRSGCTHTSTVGRPYVSGAYAWLAVSFKRSVGCAGNASVTGVLQWRGGVLNQWNERGRTEFPALRPGNGYSATFRSNSSCGAGTGTWRGLAFFGGSSAGQSTSADTSLACRG
jgi:hypothetical protein